MSQLNTRTGPIRNQTAGRPGFVNVNSGQPNLMPSSGAQASIPGLSRSSNNSQLNFLRQGMKTGMGFTTNQLKLTQPVTGLPTGRNTESCPPIMPGQAISRSQLKVQGNVPNSEQRALTPQEKRELRVLNAMEIQALPEYRIVGISHVMIGDEQISKISRGQITRT